MLLITENIAMQNRRILYVLLRVCTCITLPQSSKKWWAIPRVIQIYVYKIRKLRRAIFSWRLFSAVVTVKDFVGTAWIKFSLSRELSIVNVLAVNKANLVPRAIHLRYNPGNPQVCHQVVSGLLVLLSCIKSVKIRLVTTCHLQTYKLVPSLRITSFGNKLASCL